MQRPGLVDAHLHHLTDLGGLLGELLEPVGREVGECIGPLDAGHIATSQPALAVAGECIGPTGAAGHIDTSQPAPAAAGGGLRRGRERGNDHQEKLISITVEHKLRLQGDEGESVSLNSFNF